MGQQSNHRTLPWALALFLVAAAAHADTGKLLLTGGVSSIDGAAGGGLTPWALTGSYATNAQLGGTAHATRVRTHDYGLTIAGVAASYSDRFELSLAQQDFDTGATGAALGLPGLRLKQDIAGAKLRIFGEAILDSDTWVPQVALGVQAKRARSGGARRVTATACSRKCLSPTCSAGASPSAPRSAPSPTT